MMKRKSSILDRARTVLKTTGTLGAASAGQFVDNFCDEAERKAWEQADNITETESCDLEPQEGEKEEKKE